MHPLHIINILTGRGIPTEHTPAEVAPPGTTHVVHGPHFSVEYICETTDGSPYLHHVDELIDNLWATPLGTNICNQYDSCGGTINEYSGEGGAVMGIGYVVFMFMFIVALISVGQQVFGWTRLLGVEALT
ncbi:hypothetical protein BJY04DRAFT_192546 [Aspergillus karnatakaensis]|uniref:uncharacterized protein n=1 Tax=Aspergillus karnatakaensis TaxID=1810916 RepID=UPI003CCD4381